MRSIQIRNDHRKFRRDLKIVFPYPDQDILFSTNCATLLSQRETKLVGIRKEIKTFYRNILACTFP